MLPESRSQDEARKRIRAAVIALVADRGYEETKLADVLRHANVASDDFERLFADLDSCMVEVAEEIKIEFLECTGGAFAAESTWADAVRASGYSFCHFILEEPLRIRFPIELTFRSELVRADRDFVLDAYTELLHQGRHERPEAADVPRARAEGLIGAIWERFGPAILDGEVDQLPRAMPEMMYLIVMPYLGVAAANEELRRGPSDLARFERGWPLKPVDDGS